MPDLWLSVHFPKTINMYRDDSGMLCSVQSYFENRMTFQENMRVECFSCIQQNNIIIHISSTDDENNLPFIF